MDNVDVTKFFEEAARRLGIPAHQLATLINGYHDWTTREWENIYEESGIEIADISSLHASLASLHVKSKLQ